MQERKESKIGVSVNPDDANNLGKIHVGLVAAKDLVKTDKLSKSDPYAILSHGNQKFKTDTVKNTQNPEFNYEAEFNVPDSGDGTIKVKLFDADRLGKDKPLGSAVLDVEKVMGAGAVPAGWYPLQGVKSGQVLMAAEFEPSEAAASRLGSPDRRLAGQQEEEERPEGVLHLDLLQARNLPKSDLVGKSDPYATVGLGDQIFKTETDKNTQNPQWNFGADFVIDDDTPANIVLDVLDQDKFGKDESLGSAVLPVDELLDRDGEAGPVWVPLSGSGSPAVQVETNFVPSEDSNRRMSGHGVGKSRNPAGAQKLKDQLGGDRRQSGAGDDTVIGPNSRKGSQDILSGPNSRRGSQDILSGPNSRKGSQDILSGPNSRKGSQDILSSPKSRKGSQDILSGPNSRKGSQDILSGPNSRKGSQDTLSGPNSRKGSQDTLSGPNSRKGSQDITSGPISRKGSQDSKLGLGSRKGSRDSGLKSSESSGSLLGEESKERGARELRDKLGDQDKNRQEGAGDGGPLTENLIPGILHLDLLQAKDLVKSDLIGKSDPYAVVSFDDEKQKTKTVKNSQNPEWNFKLDIPVDSDGPKKVNIEVFDKDRIGKDKPLGSTCLDVADLQGKTALKYLAQTKLISSFI